MDITTHSFEEAVALTGIGKFHYFLVVTAGAAILGMVTEGMNMGFVLPVARCELNISTTEQGLINAIAFIGVVLSSHFWGFMADTWGRQKVLRTALATGFLFSVVSSFSTSSVMLMITRLFVGLTISGVQASAFSYLGEFHCNENRAKYVTLAAMCTSMSAIYQPLMGLFVMPMPWQFEIFGLLYTPWRMYILISSLINAVAFGLMMFLPESPKFLLAMGKPDEALAILRRVYSMNTGKPQETFPVQAILNDATGSSLSNAHGVTGVLSLMWRQTWPLFRTPYLRNMLMIFYLGIVTFSASHGFYLWMPQILSNYYQNMHEPYSLCQAVQLAMSSSINETLNADDEQSECVAFVNEPTTYYIILIFGGTFLALYLLAAFNSKRFGMKYILSTWILVSVFAYVGVIFGANFYLNMVLVLIAVTCGNCGGILSAISGDLFPTHLKGMALCFIMMSGRIGAIVGSNYTGALIEGNCDVIFILNASILLVGSGLCYLVVQATDQARNKGKLEQASNLDNNEVKSS